MNPHFIFNCLQAIQSFIEEKRAVKYLSSFGALTRSVLENSRMESIPLDKEIALLRHYLDLQKMLHEQQFDYTIYIDPKLDPEDITIPPMLAQPFIENAIEHGMRDIESGGMIEIRFTMDDHFLYFEAKDNGVGLNQNVTKSTEHRSLATVITSERLELINKGRSKKATFTISESFPGHKRKGVKVNFRIPV
jgi:LytS/YehU family sensor histidine kinase